MMFSPDSAIDGAVLEVILRKAEEIRKATGVTVPLPEERGPVTDALMASMMLRRGVSPIQPCASMGGRGGSALLPIHCHDHDRSAVRTAR
ncbi:MAG: DNA/RNA helicase [Enhydrobacter sp.]|jgi:hypothetical protein|nr:MAG: DNA/RNA helicase [Enhydrobacter sp.]